MTEMTKWPRLVVQPEPGHTHVTPEQAGEIILRTNGDYLGCNDREWEAEVARILGILPGEPWPNGQTNYLAWDRVEAWYQSINGLPIQYCRNSRIMSAWVGGPHGWVNWDGSIGCSTWNIGKWPSATEVENEWTLIARAFPYLDLHVQCIADEGEGAVAAQWRVTGGAVTSVPPAEDKFLIYDLDGEELRQRFIDSHGEHGCTAEQLTEAIQHLRGVTYDIRDQLPANDPQ